MVSRQRPRLTSRSLGRGHLCRDAATQVDAALLGFVFVLLVVERELCLRTLLQRFQLMQKVRSLIDLAIPDASGDLSFQDFDLLFERARLLFLQQARRIDFVSLHPPTARAQRRCKPASPLFGFLPCGSKLLRSHRHFYPDFPLRPSLVCVQLVFFLFCALVVHVGRAPHDAQKSRRPCCLSRRGRRPAPEARSPLLDLIQTLLHFLSTFVGVVSDG
mmetsp:Transcript_49552/g.130329  ORF Transcript_49552/g.130329 Transcript_49552/m.130329 type:complete len:217 (+) Transcript_49552:287-937(+)